MDSGQISLRVHLLWEKAGIFTKEPVKKLSCNIIRKSTSTGLREIKSSHLQEVADLMTHSTKTANEHYYVRERQKAASIGSNVIRQFFHGESCQSPPKHKWSVAEIAKLQETYGHLLTQKEVHLTDINTRFAQLNIDVSVKQVYDKVRSMLRYSARKHTKVSYLFSDVKCRYNETCFS